MTVHYFEPAAVVASEPTPYDLSIDLASQHATVALVANGFSGSERFLDYLDRALQTSGAISVRRYRKPDVSSRMPEAMISEVAATCDAVVGAYGHCGSCTSGTVRDAVALARAGRPSVAMVTRKFADEAAFIARAAGMPTLPRIELPHPMAGLTDHELDALAPTVADELINTLRGGRA